MLQHTAIITPLHLSQNQKLSPRQNQKPSQSMNPFLYTDAVDFLVFLPAVPHQQKSLPAGDAVRHLLRSHLRRLPAVGGAVRHPSRLRSQLAAGGAVRHPRRLRSLPPAGGAVRHPRKHLRSLPPLEPLLGGAVRTVVILMALMCVRLTRFCVMISASVNPRLS